MMTRSLALLCLELRTNWCPISYSADNSADTINSHTNKLKKAEAMLQANSSDVRLRDRARGAGRMEAARSERGSRSRWGVNHESMARECA